MKKFVYKLLAFGFLLLALSPAANFLLFDDIHSYTRMMLEEMYHYDGNIDTLFVGSSHVYRSFDPRIADRMLGRKTFNAGSSSQGIDTSYYLLKEVAARNRLQTVYLDLYYAVLQDRRSGTSIQQQIVTDYMRPGWNKLEFLWDTAGLAAVADCVFRFRHGTKDVRTQIDALKAKLTGGFKPGDYRHIRYDDQEYMGKGYVFSRSVADPETLAASSGEIDPAMPIPPESAAYLDRIVGFCKEKNIELVLVTAPMPPDTIRNTRNYQRFIDYVQAYAGRNRLEHYDFNLMKASALPLLPGDFQDGSHLNGMGAEKFTRSFCAAMNALNAGTASREDLFYSRLSDRWAELG